MSNQQQPSSTGRIGFVVPRYGAEIVGGAERLVRGYAEQLHARGYQVDVFATCTTDMVEWNNNAPPGSTTVNGVPVHRFPTDKVDVGQIHRTAGKAAAGVAITYAEQLEFLRQSVNSQALYQHIRERQDEYQCFVFAPYLFGTTYWGMQAVPDKALLLPCLHDEVLARFVVYRELLEQARGVLFNVEAERRFAYDTLGMVNPNTTVVGYGFDADTPQGDGVAFRTRHNLPERYVYYTGRIQQGKNVPLLLDYFVRYKNEHPGDLALVLSGEGEVIQLARPDVVEIGFLDADELHDAYAAATLFCLPSVNESFSIVTMEAWLQGTPVLVNGNSAVMLEHIQRSDGGWSFTSYDTFRDALNQSLADAAQRRQRGANGKAYVQREYGWDVVVGRLIDAIGRFGGAATLREQLVRRGIRRAMDFSRERFEEQLTSIVMRAEADLAQGLTHTQVDALRDAAHVGMPEYQVQSGAPVVGGLVASLRRNMTSHLREPYLDPIIQRQEAYNTMLLDTLIPALERSLRAQQRLERQVRLLEQKVEQLQRTTGSDSTT